MTVAEAAKVLEISPALVYDLCRTGKLAFMRFGSRGRGVIRISPEDLDDFRRRCRCGFVEAEEEKSTRTKTRRLTVPDWLGSVERRKGRA